MPTEVLIAIIALIQGLGVAIISGLLQRNSKNAEAERAEENKRREEEKRKQEEKDKIREERDLALYDLVRADAMGTEVVCRQLHGEKLNGNLEEALDAIVDAREKFEHVCTRTAVKL